MDSIISLIISFIALVVSVIVLIYTARIFLLKSGVNIRGSYSVISSISCQDKYVGSVTLVNLKDRAIVIFKIYLRLGHNYFLEIDDFENDPLILKPFEVFKKEYDPIDFYSVNLSRILLDQLFECKPGKRQLLLSTSDGKYIVKQTINRWDPIFAFFKNYMTAIITPMRSTFKDKAYGSNAMFIVELKMEKGKEQIIPIYPRDYERKTFRQFDLTKESLESRKSLEEYLYEKACEGKLYCYDILVHDIENWRKEVYNLEDKDVIEASYQNWFIYYIIGPIYTKLSNYRTRKKNKKLRRHMSGDDKGRLVS